MIRAFLTEQAQNLKDHQISKTLSLLEEGCTVPFISRYRKEATGGLDEVQIGAIKEANDRHLEFEKRKKYILSAIQEQEGNHEEVIAQVQGTTDPQELEDLYLPFKRSKKTKAQKARDLGLEPLAASLMKQSRPLEELVSGYARKCSLSEQEAEQGAGDIIAEWLSERRWIRNDIRRSLSRGVIQTKIKKGKEEEAIKFKDYFDFSEPIVKSASHRILAMYRGEKEGLLSLKLTAPDLDQVTEKIQQKIVKNPNYYDWFTPVLKDALKRLILPSIEKEIRTFYKEKADRNAVLIFRENLKQLLLARPYMGKRILAIDPGFRTGCKVVILDEFGSPVHNETIYPHPPRNEKTMAVKKITSLVSQYKVRAIAIGNGTASRETEGVISRIRFKDDVKVFIVDESGASIYSASKVAREEFPQYDVTVRGTISIGRRLIDPLAELVKIEPWHLGVGQYQHDVDEKLLKTALDETVMNCVNAVGVDIDSASTHLLQYISGIGPSLAQKIASYRNEKKGIKSRKELLKVPGFGAKVYEQAAGFIRVQQSKNPLDRSAVHPERYKLVEKMAKQQNVSLEELVGNEVAIARINFDSFITDEIGKPTLELIKKELEKPGRDPRKLGKVMSFDEGLRTIDDVQEGMEVPGIVTNLTSFGAFVDIGIKENGLIHISQMADRFVSNPAEVVALHQHLMVKVLSVDIERKRIQLTLKGLENEG